MKNLIRRSVSLVCLLFLIICALHAQGMDVPSKVKEAFANKFPNARQVEWGRENTNEFEAEFTVKGTHMSANFDPEGNWKETEVEIAQSDLPSAVQQTLTNDYSEAEVEHIYKVSQPGKTRYEVAVAGENEEQFGENGGEENEHEENEEAYEEERTYELVFTTDGKLVKNEQANEEED